MSTSLQTNSIVLDNVDDYLAPSQACINPLFQPKKSAVEGRDGESDGGNNNNSGPPTRDSSTTSTSTSIGAVVVPRRRRRVVRPAPLEKYIEKEQDNVIEADMVDDRGGENTTTQSMTDSKSALKRAEEKARQDPVKASIADCLACSGCVTTAETVLLEQRHSLKSLRERLTLKSGETTIDSAGSNVRRRHRHRRAITISPNSWADLCRHWDLHKPRHEQKITTMDGTDVVGDDGCEHFFYARFVTLLSQILSAELVIDGNVPLQWTWIDEAEEFCHAYERDRHHRMATSEPITVVPPYPSVAINSNKTQYYKPDGRTMVVSSSDGSSGSTNDYSDSGMDTFETVSPPLPVIGGSCPALVCLVEKTLTTLVPHLSQTMSPMSILGTLLKQGDSNRSQQQVWDHWSIMPCHDKKLEASRRDFVLGKNQLGDESHSVDLVISTQECVELVEEWIMQQIDTRSSCDGGVSNDTKPTSPVVYDYLAALPPCDVSTILEPKELLENVASVRIKPMFVAAPRMRQTIDELDQSKSATADTTTAYKQMAFASGGHANFIFLYAAKKLFGCTLWATKPGQAVVEWTPASLLAAKNVKSVRLSKQQKQHYYEAKLYHHPEDGSYSMVKPSGSGANVPPVLHFAIAHGMQTMQRALKHLQIKETTAQPERNGQLHYLEAMACPNGCVNGGGSVRSASTAVSAATTTTTSTVSIRETPTETRHRIGATLGYLEVPDPATPLTPSLLCSQKETEFTYTGSRYPRTRYHVVPPMIHTMGAVAGENVENILW
jgi:iron only hydrogenase large subunit-like protein